MPRASMITPEKFTTFGELLRFLRRKANLTQRELSIAVGYSESQISRLEQNERAPEEATLAARFVPALYIDYEPQWVARLLELGAATHASAPKTDALQPIAEAKPTPHNLPIQLTSFIGREKEITEVKRHILNKRLVTLTGPGGCGKTRLAVETASGLLGDFPHGVWLVELAPLADPALVPQTMAVVLGLKEDPSRPLINTLANHLHGKKVLLILDNCEHLIEASAQLAESLLHSCLDLHILATSREVLGAAGEISFLVPSLSSPDPAQAIQVDTLSKYESVQLFMDRAVTVLRGFAVTNDNAGAIAQVCHRLDGIPLAIELAAARIKLLRVEQIAERLDDRFQLLTGGERTAMPRHQTLAALIDWSHDLLTEPERILLRRLSVFAGGWMLDAAEAVCVGDSIEGSHVLDLLTQLVNKSLVIAERAQGEEARYRMLETIRQYALEKLMTSGEAEALRKRHAMWYLRLAEARVSLSAQFPPAWQDRMETEHDNIRAALAWSHSMEGNAELELRLSEALGKFWSNRAYWDEGRGWLEGALAHADIEGVENTQLRAEALLHLGSICSLQSDFEAGQVYFMDSLKLYQELEDTSMPALVLIQMGGLARQRGDVTTARLRLEEGLAIFRQIGDKGGIAYALMTLGDVLIMQEDAEGATRLLEESLLLSRECNDRSGTGWVLNHLGRVAQIQGQYERAIHFHEESLEYFREGWQGLLCLASVYQGLGETALAQGNATLAATHLAESLRLSHDFEDRAGISWCLAGLAGVAALNEEPERAAWLWGAAEASRQSIGARHAPAARATHERLQAEVRKQLGEVMFSAKWAEGQAASVEQAIDEATR